MTKLGDDVLECLATCRYFNRVILEQAEKDIKKNNTLGLAGTLSILPDSAIEELRKPYPKELFSKLRYYELVNSYVNNMLNRGYSRGDILNGNLSQ